MLENFEDHFYGSQLSNSTILATDAYGWGFHLKKKSIPNLLIKYLGVFHLGARIRARLLVKIINEKSYEKSTLLDAGCGMGLTSIFLSKRFKSIVGVDLDKDKIKQAKILSFDNRIKNSSFKECDIEKVNFVNKKFDVIICFEVIEHVRDYKKLIKSLSTKLNKKGIIILSFPSKSFISALAQKSLGHVKVGFLPIEIKEVASLYKLKIKKEYSFGNTYIAQWIVAVDFFIKKTIPMVSPVFFPLFYPLLVFDLYLPKMGVPRGYILILKKNEK